VIRVDTISIKEFRGIRDLTLHLARKNFAICGPNGTGKSGVVDAIEFALTGNVSRLSGSGTGGLSVKDHGPHVDSRNKPDQSSVTVGIYIPTLQKKVTISRRVSEPRKPTISPNDKSISEILRQIQDHPEFTLSRRELIRYVLSEPGKRAKEVQALLRLEEVETLRATFQRIANAEDKSVSTLGRVQKGAADNLLRALAITQCGASKVLEAINAKRDFLGLPIIAALEPTTVLNDGVVTAAGATPVSRVPKNQAQADIKALRKQIGATTSDTAQTECEAAKHAAQELAKDAASLDGVERQELLASALKLFDEYACPVCDTAWEPERFREVVAAKHKHLEDAAERRQLVEAKFIPVIDRLEKLSASVSSVSRYGALLSPPVDAKPMSDYSSSLLTNIDQLKKLLPIDSTCAALDAVVASPVAALATLHELDTQIAALPEPSQQEAAREFLTVGQERLLAYQSASLRLKAAKERADVAATVLEQYGKLTTAALEEIYEKVEDTFTTLYREINKDDEEEFQAKLIPSMGKLGFDVDFYGRGFFPQEPIIAKAIRTGWGFAYTWPLWIICWGNSSPSQSWTMFLCRWTQGIAGKSARCFARDSLTPNSL
jgi:hypothetical protein